jgi:hypothetical protein
MARVTIGYLTGGSGRMSVGTPNSSNDTYPSDDGFVLDLSAAVVVRAILCFNYGIPDLDDRTIQVYTGSDTTGLTPGDSYDTGTVTCPTPTTGGGGHSILTVVATNHLTRDLLGEHPPVDLDNMDRSGDDDLANMLLVAY